MGLATIDSHIQEELTEIHKILKFGVNQASFHWDKAIWKCQNLQRNVWHPDVLSDSVNVSSFTRALRILIRTMKQQDFRDYARWLWYFSYMCHPFFYRDFIDVFVRSAGYWLLWAISLVPAESNVSYARNHFKSFQMCVQILRTCVALQITQLKIQGSLSQL